MILLRRSVKKPYFFESKSPNSLGQRGICKFYYGFLRSCTIIIIVYSHWIFQLWRKIPTLPCGRIIDDSPSVALHQLLSALEPRAATNRIFFPRELPGSTPWT